MRVLEEIPRELLDFFAKTQIDVLDDDFLIINIAERSEILKEMLRMVEGDFFTAVFEKNEVTLVMSKDVWNRFSTLFENPRVEESYKVLTLKNVLNRDKIGYLTLVTKLLAGVGISVGVISSFQREHLLIKKQDLSSALGILKRFFRDCPAPVSAL